MAETARTGPNLLADIAAAEAVPETGYFWWLGQHSFVVKLAGTVVYVDPYLAPSPARQTPPLFAPDEVTNADLVLCTHDHLDHIDPVAIAGIVQASPGAQFVAPRPHRERMLQIGVPEARLHLLNDGEEATVAGVRITALKARHEFFQETPEGFPFLGYVFQANGVTAYHSGDTLIYDGLFTSLRRWKLDVAFLPINGRDATRYRANCLGNMTYQEAVELAGDLNVGLAVPAHWDMFRNNSEDPAKFLDYLDAKYPHVRAWTGPAGERVRFTANH